MLKKMKIDIANWKHEALKNFENSLPFLEYEKSTGLIDFIIDSAESFLFI